MKTLDVNMKALIALIVLFSLSLSLMAQPSPRNRQFSGHESRSFGMLDLTTDQKAEMKAIHIAKIKEIQPLKDEIRINNAKIEALLKKDDPNMNEIVKLVEANGKLLTDIKVKSIESRINIRSLLTEDQKVIFDAKQHRRKRAVAHRHAMRRGPSGERSNRN